MAVVLSCSYVFTRGGYIMITTKQRELLLSYFYNNRQFLHNDVRQLQQNVRYRDINTVDCLELIIALEKYNAFCEFCDTVTTILSLQTASENNVNCT